MAGEIKVTTKLIVDKGFYHRGDTTSTTVINQTGTGGGVPGQVSAITTGQGTSVSTAGLTTPGWIKMTNVDPTNKVEWGPLVAGTLHVIGEMKPGESVLFRLKSTAALNLRALVATCLVQVEIIED